MRCFHNKVHEGVESHEFFRHTSYRTTVKFSPDFGNEALARFNAPLCLAFPAFTLTSTNRHQPFYDVGCFSYTTSITVFQLHHCTVMLPLSVRRLDVIDSAKSVHFVGTERLTSLSLENDTCTVSSCPSLQELTWTGGASSPRHVPCDLLSLTALERLYISSPVFDEPCPLPLSLECFTAQVTDGSFPVSALTHLTNLHRLDISVDKYTVPLDLSGLSSLTSLDTNASPVGGLPRSLVTARVRVCADVDLAPLTCLTSLEVSLRGRRNITFPTQLADLTISDGWLGRSNIASVGLTAICCYSETFTRRRLEELPRTLQTIDVQMDSDVRRCLTELFPLYHTSDESLSDG